MMLLASCGDTIPDESTNESLETSNGTEQSYRTLISAGKSYAAENVTEFGEAVKNAGTNFIWIPYYSANRFYLGESEECTVTITVK